MAIYVKCTQPPWGAVIFEATLGRDRIAVGVWRQNERMASWWREFAAGTVMDVAFSADGSRVAVTRWNERPSVLIWEVGKAIEPYLSVHVRGASSAIFDKSTRFLLVQGERKPIVLDLATGQLKQVQCSGDILNGSFTAHGNAFTLPTNRKGAYAILHFDGCMEESRALVPGFERVLPELVHSPMADMFVVSDSSRNEARMLQWPTGDCLWVSDFRELRMKRAAITASSAFCGSGQFVAVSLGGGADKLVVFEATSGKLVRTLNLPGSVRMQPYRGSSVLVGDGGLLLDLSDGSVSRAIATKLAMLKKRMLPQHDGQQERKAE